MRTKLFVAVIALICLCLCFASCSFFNGDKGGESTNTPSGENTDTPSGENTNPPSGETDDPSGETDDPSADNEEEVKENVLIYFAGDYILRLERDSDDRLSSLSFFNNRISFNDLKITVNYDKDGKGESADFMYLVGGFGRAFGEFSDDGSRGVYVSRLYNSELTVCFNDDGSFASWNLKEGDRDILIDFCDADKIASVKYNDFGWECFFANNKYVYAEGDPRELTVESELGDTEVTFNEKGLVTEFDDKGNGVILTVEYDETLYPAKTRLNDDGFSVEGDIKLKDGGGADGIFTVYDDEEGLVIKGVSSIKLDIDAKKTHIYAQSYDADGKLTSCEISEVDFSDGISRTTIKRYDEEDLLQTVTVSYLEDGVSVLIVEEYDDEGKLESKRLSKSTFDGNTENTVEVITDPDGNFISKVETVTVKNERNDEESKVSLVYNAEDKLESSDGVFYEYDEYGEIVTLCNEYREYDENGNEIIFREHRRDGDYNLIESIESSAEYDEDGNPVKKVTVIFGEHRDIVKHETVEYSYYEDGEMQKKAIVTMYPDAQGGEAYRVDNVLINDEEGRATMVIEFSYARSGDITDGSYVEYLYDANGNTAKKETTLYANNEQISAETVTATYNENGDLLTRKVEYTDLLNGSTAYTEESYVYEDGLETLYVFKEYPDGKNLENSIRRETVYDENGAVITETVKNYYPGGTAVCCKEEKTFEYYTDTDAVKIETVTKTEYDTDGAELKINIQKNEYRKDNSQERSTDTKIVLKDEFSHSVTVLEFDENQNIVKEERTTFDEDGEAEAVSTQECSYDGDLYIKIVDTEKIFDGEEFIFILKDEQYFEYGIDDVEYGKVDVVKTVSYSFLFGEIDGIGKTLTKTNEKGETLYTLYENYSADGVLLGSIESFASSRESGSNLTTTVERDENGNIIETVEKECEYNENGELVCESIREYDRNLTLLREELTTCTYDGNVIVLEKTCVYEYGMVHSVKSTEYLYDEDGALRFEISATFDGEGKLLISSVKETVTTESESEHSLVETVEIYDARDGFLYVNVYTETLNVVNGVLIKTSEESVFNESGVVESVKYGRIVKNGKTEEKLLRTDRYDEFGNLVSQVERNKVGNNISVVYYDGEGNVLSKENHGSAVSADGITETKTVERFSADGDLLEKEVFDSTYDALGRLVKSVYSYFENGTDLSYTEEVNYRYVKGSDEVYSDYTKYDALGNVIESESFDPSIDDAA